MARIAIRIGIVVSLLFVLGCVSEEAPRKTPFDSDSVVPPNGAADSYSETVEMVGTIEYRQLVTGALPERRHHGYTFVANQGDSASLLLRAAGHNTPFDPVLLVYGPLEAGFSALAHPLVSNDDMYWPTRTDSFIADFPIPADGTYLVVVVDYSGQGGEYRLRLTCSSGQCAWEWTAEPASPKGLSEVGTAVLEAVLAADQNQSTVPAEEILATRNAAGPALVDGPEIFGGMADIVANAEHEVDFQTYLFDEFVGLDEFHDALLRLEHRQRSRGRFGRPVVVRMIVDGFYVGPRSVSSRARLVYDGIAQLALDPSLVVVEIGTFQHAAWGVLHTKLVVVDGVIAHIGGANFQNKNEYNEPWHDAAFLLRGEIARSLLEDFDQAWAASVLWECGTGWWGRIDCNRRNGGVRPPHAPEVLSPNLDADPLLPPGDGIPMVAMTRTAADLPGTNIESPLAQGLLAALAAARGVVRIQSPTLSGAVMRDAVIDAVSRGVEVQIILSKSFHEFAMAVPGQGGNNSQNVSILMDRVEKEVAPEYRSLLQIRWHSFDGVSPVSGLGPRASHLKYISMDEQVVIVGSANVDQQTLYHSREVDVAIDSPLVTSMWDELVFRPDWEQSLPVQ